jgi:hypothetical protein
MSSSELAAEYGDSAAWLAIPRADGRNQPPRFLPRDIKTTEDAVLALL